MKGIHWSMDDYGLLKEIANKSGVRITEVLAVIALWEISSNSTAMILDLDLQTVEEITRFIQEAELLPENGE